MSDQTCAGFGEPEIDTRDRAKDDLSVIRYLAHADGYVMCRRPGAVPFVLSAKIWAGLRPVGKA